MILAGRSPANITYAMCNFKDLATQCRKTCVNVPTPRRLMPQRDYGLVMGIGLPAGLIFTIGELKDGSHYQQIP
jgi:hypothetical protein